MQRCSLDEARQRFFAYQEGEHHSPKQLAHYRQETGFSGFTPIMPKAAVYILIRRHPLCVSFVQIFEALACLPVRHFCCPQMG